MSKLYRFYYNEKGTYKEISKMSDDYLTLDELRNLFYDWLASLGYQVQSQSEVKE